MKKGEEKLQSILLQISLVSRDKYAIIIILLYCLHALARVVTLATRIVIF